MHYLQKGQSRTLHPRKEVRAYGVITMTGDFIKIKCPDCANEQIGFRKAATKVTCNVCGSTLIVPQGGVGEIKGEILEVVG